ncbi:pyruvate dehydrogenase E2 component (dihydrolipoamide acetyltransferase) [Psychromicrobium silvestre]|uniref:Dihydrolipoamide acetyltransferase component of pyruvate dehydrogenase complex n=1 Tax=Psychromicrobium silvestre TaxID=1645614 RepID=A0A7Y9S8M4_9MICC|nr:dihydrolipoamide acetyltransferase family protein [Psychromicrobium silvestre]NYE95497.1 pyruvate dehydrogenase E2 component (dihydrolipoamide acetyltransferase) [Psychromicrobium silvestre]
MADQVFLLPDLGEGLTEAELVRWLVAEGERIVVDQPVAEVETAKSVVEVPSPFGGVVARLHGEAGQLMDVGKPFLSVATETDSEPDVGQATPPIDQHEGYREEERAGSGNVLIGYGTSGHGVTGRSRPRKNSSPAVQTSRAGNLAAAPLVSSPLVRKLARELGLRLSEVSGSGPGGLILRKDVERSATSVAIRAADEPSFSDAQDKRSGLAIRSRTPLSGTRRTIAAAMSRSRSEIPEATVWVDVDATALVEMRTALKKRDPEGTPSLLAFIARFVLAGLVRFPELNSRIVASESSESSDSSDPSDPSDPSESGKSGGEDVLLVEGVNLGFAAQTERGLMVPSIRNAHTLSARELDAEIRRLTAVARAGKASPAELSSGTFTLNNYGVFGVDGSAAIINYPEAAILGVGRIIDKPWVVDGELAVRKLTELTLVFDHRVCDGGTAGGFLRFVADAIENPAGLLADL